MREPSDAVSVLFFDAVLLDWMGTLFNDQDDASWIRAAAASIGRELSDDQIASLLEGMDAAAAEPDTKAALDRCDTSLEIHREINLAFLRASGCDDDLAVAIWQRAWEHDARILYPDTEPVLRTLHEHGVRIVVVSDIHYDIRAHFVHHDLDQYVDAYVLSFEHGIQKPDEELYRRALEAAGVTPDRALMVGDRPSHDGAAANYGIASYILDGPFRAGNAGPRGLDAVLRLVGIG